MRRELRFVVGAGITTLALQVGGVGVANGDAPASSSTSASAAELPLAELPSMPAAVLPPPKPAAIQSLDARLEQLVAKRVAHPIEPKLDYAFLTGELDDDLVPAIAQRLEQLRRSIQGNAAIAVLERARKLGSKELHKEKRRSGKSTPARRSSSPDASKESKEAQTPDATDGDWLQFALALGGHDDEAWRDLVHVYGMLRMLESLGTTPAVREMLNAYAYFGELVRIDLQRAIERLGDKAVPALIEAREHDAKRVREWARREMDILGRAVPGEAIATNDAEVLADVLLAYGRVKDVDAARVILSFVASERVQLRKAARQAIVAIGEPATWNLREAYETATGDKPPRGWDARRLAQELFRLHDRTHLTAVHELMGQGLEAWKKSDGIRAAGIYDQVLARAPMFERRKEMVPAYVARATTLENEGKYEDALVDLRKALRLDPDANDVAKLESRVATLEGRILFERGTPDPFILKRAVELDAANRDARELLSRIETKTVATETRTKRYVAAGAISLLAIAAILALLRRKDTTPPKSAGAPDVSAAPLRDSATSEADSASVAQPTPTGEAVAATVTSPHTPDGEARANEQNATTNDQADDPNR